MRICWQEALLVSAMSAAHEHGFMPEAYRRTERIALARIERFSAFWAKIFFFCGMLCSYNGGYAEP
jgi:hypothetical protein